MNAVVDLFNSLFDVKKLAAITVPGLATALAITLYLWVPRTDDLIAVPKGLEVAHPDIVYHEAAYPCTPPSFVRLLDKDTAVVSKTDAKVVLQHDTSKHVESYIVTNQRILENARVGFQQCLATDAMHLIDDSANTEQARALVQLFSTERDSIQRLNLVYQRTGSPLRGTTEQRFLDANARVDRARRLIQQYGDSARRIRLGMARESLYIARIGERLNDPARRKPGQGVDDVLAAAANHAIAFLALTGLCGMALGPVQAMLSGWLFDGIFGALWNRMRPGRFWVHRPSRKTEGVKRAQVARDQADRARTRAALRQLRSYAVDGTAYGK